MKEEKIKISHGIFQFSRACYRSFVTTNLVLPKKFHLILEKKFRRYEIPMAFTYVFLGIYHAISVVSKKDQFNRKLGVKIAMGRLNHLFQGIYDRNCLPEWVEIEEVEKHE